MAQHQQALSCAETALEKEPDSNEALIAKALAQLRLGNSADASVCHSEATMNAPENPYLAIIRGWVLKDYRRQKKNADMSFERVLDMDLAPVSAPAQHLLQQRPPGGPAEDGGGGQQGDAASEMFFSSSIINMV